MENTAHYSVLLEESVSTIVCRGDGLYIDATFGRGGHSRAILQRLTAAGRVIGIDKDPQAVAAGRELAATDPRFEIVHGSFADIKRIARAGSIDGLIDGVLFDLGVSSPQLDEAERGFSFLHDGPLDMRMNNLSGRTAAEWINTVKEDEIVFAFKEYGEERFARRMAKAICARREQRPFTRTRDLAEVITAANPKWEREKHPATRAFQAIRIAVNNELDDLQMALREALAVLKPGGRIGVISFHSLEDRIVKRFFKEQVQGIQYPKEVPITEDMQDKTMRLLSKAIKASANELSENVRSRSAVLRLAEKL